MKEKLRALIQEQIKKSFVPEYQAGAPDHEALGILISNYFEWDGLAILKTMYAALEDSNFHSLNEQVQAMIDKLESGVTDGH